MAKKAQYVVTNTCICDGIVTVTNWLISGLNNAADKVTELKADAKEAFDMAARPYSIEDNACEIIITDDTREFNDCIIITLKEAQ